MGVVLVDACSGDSVYYPIHEAPTWIDQAYSADIVIQQIDYWGELKNGFINTIFGQRGMYTSAVIIILLWMTMCGCIPVLHLPAMMPPILICPG